MKLYGLIILATVFCYSCADKSPTENKPADSAVVATGSPDEESIRLNNGEKWKVDAHMLTFIRNMEQKVQSFDVTSEYGSLAQDLETTIDSLTSNCTMKGQAHDELHKWLLPYIDTVEELGQAGADEAPGILQSLRESFVTFNRYFE
jgi:hypothetical protein